MRGKSVCAARAACEERAPKARCGAGWLGGQRGANRHKARGVPACGAVSGTGSRLDTCGGSRGNNERPRSDGGDRLREHPKYVRQRVHLVAAALPHATPSDRHPAVRPDRKVPLSQAVSRIIRQATPNRTIRRRAKSRSRDRHPDGRTDQSLFFRWSFPIRGEFWRIRQKI